MEIVQPEVLVGTKDLIGQGAPNINVTIHSLSCSKLVVQWMAHEILKSKISDLVLSHILNSIYV